MDRYSDVVQNENGRAVPGASILIVGSDGQPATIYADRQGARRDNPIVTDSLGRWSFCAADGLYTARVSFNGVVKAELRDIRLEDPDDGFASLARTTGAGLIGMTDGRTVQTAFSQLSDTVAGLSNYTLPIASASTLGGIRIGTGLAIDPNGIVSLTYSYTLPIASSASLGGVRVGMGLAIDSSGILSATGLTQGSVSSVNGVTPNSSGALTLSTDDIAEDSNPINLWFTNQRVRNADLSGLSTSTSFPVIASDTVLTAAGKLQAQVNSTNASLAGKQSQAEKGAPNGYAGLGPAQELLLPNSAGTFTSAISNTNTAARAYVLPDKPGTFAMTSDLPLSTSFVSSDQVITNNGSLTIAHGLGSVPKIVCPFLRCLTAAQDAVPGQIQAAPTVAVIGGNFYNCSIKSDASNIYIRFASGNSTTVFVNFNGQPYQNASFALFVRAYV